jgi:IstB-like ATP binding protein
MVSKHVVLARRASTVSTGNVNYAGLIELAKSSPVADYIVIDLPDREAWLTSRLSFAFSPTSPAIVEMEMRQDHARDQAGQFHHRLARRAGGEIKVVLVKGLDHREAGHPREHLARFGRGQNSLAIALGYLATQKGYKTRFFSAADLVLTLEAAQSQGRYRECAEDSRPDTDGRSRRNSP